MPRLPLLLLALVCAVGAVAQDLTWSTPQWVDSNDAPEVLPEPKRLRSPPMPEAFADYEHPAYASYLVTVSAKGEAMSGPFHSPLPWLERRAWQGDRFEPAQREGRPVTSEILLHLIFNPRSARESGANATPRLLSVVPPAYPALPAGEKPASFTVLMMADVDAAGAVVASEPVQPDLGPQIVAPARAALRQWRFAPARADGKAVAARVQVPVLFVPASTKLPGDLAVPPRVTHQTPPVYPFGMRVANVNGEVLVGFVVTVEGRVRDAFILRSSHPGFDEAAVEAVEKWRFEPGIYEGRPVNTRMQVPMIFQIAGTGRPAFIVKRPKSFPKTLPEAFHFDHPPELIGVSVPTYPVEALRAGTRGKVQVSFAVGPDGRVLRAQAMKDAPSPELAAAAVAAVETFTFKPAAQKGVPCYAMVGFEFQFLPNGRGDVPVTAEMRRLLRLLDEQPEKLAKLNELDGPPRPLGRKPPVIPSVAREKGQPGEAVIDFIIDRKGFARLPRIVSATDPAFGYAAMQAISTWRFEPPRQNGQVVDAQVRIPVTFK